MERRNFLSSAVAALAGNAIPAKPIRVIDAPKDSVVWIVLGPEFYDVTDEDLERMRHKLKEQVGPDLKVVVLPSGMKVHISPTGVSQREKVGDYEYEIHAANEADLLARLKMLGYGIDTKKQITAP